MGLLDLLQEHAPSLYEALPSMKSIQDLTPSLETMEKLGPYATAGLGYLGTSDTNKIQQQHNDWLKNMTSTNYYRQVGLQDNAKQSMDTGFYNALYNANPDKKKSGLAATSLIPS